MALSGVIIRNRLDSDNIVPTLADPIDASRLVYGGTWSGLVGVIGGIPARTTIAQTLTNTATAAQINTAIANCPPGQVVFLSAGTYTAGGSIALNKSDVTLRGAVDADGVPTTILRDFNIDIAEGGAGWDPTNASHWTDIAINSGVTRGSSSLVLASAPGAITGRLIWICSQAVGTVIAGGSFATMHGSYIASQVNKVLAVNGSTVTLQDPIHGDYWTGTNRVSIPPTGKTISRSGMENLSFTTSAANGRAGRYWDFQGTDECWAYNCRTNYVDSGHHHCQVYSTYRTHIEKCEIYRTRITANGDNSNQYAVFLVQSSGFLILNNYMHSVPAVSPILHACAGMFAYNYITDLPYDDTGGNTGWLGQTIFHHGGHSCYIALEGNWVASSYNDETATGNTAHSRNTLYFRNRMRGWDPQPLPNGKTGNCQAITCDPHHDNVTVAGNVLGENGYHTLYLGTSNQPILAFDSTSAATRDLFSNYNTVNDTIPVAETLDATHALADSYLFTSKPAWFGVCPWPWCNPSNYTQSNTPTSLPAGYRAVNGVDP